MKTIIASATAADTVNAVGGLMLAAISIGALVVVVTWIFLPFLIAGRLTDLRREAEKQTALLEKIAANTRPPSDTKKEVSSVKYTMPK